MRPLGWVWSVTYYPPNYHHNKVHCERPCVRMSECEHIYLFFRGEFESHFFSYGCRRHNGCWHFLPVPPHFHASPPHSISLPVPLCLPLSWITEHALIKPSFRSFPCSSGFIKAPIRKKALLSAFPNVAQHLLK